MASGRVGGLKARQPVTIATFESPKFSLTSLLFHHPVSEKERILSLMHVSSYDKQLEKNNQS